MIKYLKSVGVLLFLSTVCNGTVYANQEGRKTDVRVTQQNGTCTGVVKDATGETIIGASVVVKGSTNGTITGIDGDFSLSNVPKGSTIVISFVGYQTQEIKWTGVPLNVILSDDTKVLDEVVVVGYGTQKKVNVTGAVSMVGSDVIESRPVANVSQALQGAVPGLNLSTSSSGGDLNTSMNINIRGTGSIGDGSVDSPLILIDGIEGDLNSLNPNDVESVSVLKDAASASIYGSRAAFGVILVTTKSGKAGKVKVNYSGDIRFSTATQVPKMANSLQFATYFNTANINAGGSNIFSDETMANIKKYMNGEFTDPSQPEYWGTTANVENGKWNNYGSAFANTDWFEEFYKKNVPSTQHNLSLSGGTEKFNWSVSGSFLLQNGLISHGHDELDRYTLNSKIGAELASWARLDYSTKWTHKDYEKPQYLTGLFFHNIARRWPSCPVVDPNGNWMAEMEIYELEDGGVYKENNDEFTQQLKFTFTPLKGWNIYAEGALRLTNNKTTQNKIPIYNYNVANEPMLRDSGYGTVTYVYDNRYKQNYYAVNVYTDYSHSFGKHNGKVLLGLNYERYNQDNMWASGTDLTTEDKPFLSQTQSNKKNGDGYWNRATAGYFGRFNYDYDGKYLAEFNIRYDGSSRFLRDQRWNWFPSFSLGWNVAREAFFEKYTNIVNTLKVRGSWGELGNQNTDNWYPFYRIIDYKQNNGGWLVNGLKPNTAAESSLVSALLGWEKTQTLNIGFDLGMLDNRFNLNFDYFQRKSIDMVGPGQELPTILGIAVPNVNNLNMTSKGWELQVSWRDQIRDFRYGVTLALSDNQVVIDKYPNPSKDLGQTYYDGAHLGDLWGYQTIGIAKTQAEMDAHLAKVDQSSMGSNWGAGDIMYADLDGDGVISAKDNTADNHGDKVLLGNKTPRYNFGLNLDAAYKGFDLKVFFQGTLKRDYMPGSGAESMMFWGAVGYWQTNFFEPHLDYFRPADTTSPLGANVDGYYPRPLESDKNRKAQSRYMQNAAYCRLKNVTLGYTLPADLTKKFYVNNLRFFVSAENLFTITNLCDTFDPETIGVGNWEGCTYPLSKTISFGLSATF